MSRLSRNLRADSKDSSRISARSSGQGPLSASYRRIFCPSPAIQNRKSGHSFHLRKGLWTATPTIGSFRPRPGFSPNASLAIFSSHTHRSPDFRSNFGSSLRSILLGHGQHSGRSTLPIHSDATRSGDRLDRPPDQQTRRPTPRRSSRETLSRLVI